MNQNTRLLLSILLATVFFSTSGCWETTDFLCKPGTDDTPTSTDTVTGEGEGEGEGSATDTGTGTGTGETDTGTVEEGNECSAQFGPLGTITGLCQQSDDPCDGGFANPDPVGAFYTGKDPKFNCKGELLCCIDTDQCAALDTGIKSFVPTVLKEGSGATCEDNGDCSGQGYIISEEFGCPAGETCCLITLM
ncbi:MAG: hypothetical protein MUC50_16705 [Myxococcota bacterium]|jgi:hypothetical protein|nr:hypothetical protein [Myxococcota bacterium]